MALAKAGYRIFGVHLDFRAGARPRRRGQGRDRGGRLRGPLHQHERRRRREAGGRAGDAARRGSTGRRPRAATRTSASSCTRSRSARSCRSSPTTRRQAVDRKKMEMTQDVMANSLVYWVQDLYRGGFLEQGSKIYAMTSEGSTRRRALVRRRVVGQGGPRVPRPPAGDGAGPPRAGAHGQRDPGRRDGDAGAPQDPRGAADDRHHDEAQPDRADDDPTGRRERDRRAVAARGPTSSTATSSASTAASSSPAPDRPMTAAASSSSARSTSTSSSASTDCRRPARPSSARVRASPRWQGRQPGGRRSPAGCRGRVRGRGGRRPFGAEASRARRRRDRRLRRRRRSRTSRPASPSSSSTAWRERHRRRAGANAALGSVQVRVALKRLGDRRRRGACRARDPDGATHEALRVGGGRRDDDPQPGAGERPRRTLALADVVTPNRGELETLVGPDARAGRSSSAGSCGAGTSTRTAALLATRRQPRRPTVAVRSAGRRSPGHGDETVDAVARSRRSTPSGPATRSTARWPPGWPRVSSSRRPSDGRWSPAPLAATRAGAREGMPTRCRARRAALDALTSRVEPRSRRGQSSAATQVVRARAAGGHLERAIVGDPPGREAAPPGRRRDRRVARRGTGSSTRPRPRPDRGPATVTAGRPPRGLARPRIDEVVDGPSVRAVQRWTRTDDVASAPSGTAIAATGSPSPAGSSIPTIHGPPCGAGPRRRGRRRPRAVPRRPLDDAARSRRRRPSAARGPCRSHRGRPAGRAQPPSTAIDGQPASLPAGSRQLPGADRRRPSGPASGPGSSPTPS